jgi:hypothetical protein
MAFLAMTETSAQSLTHVKMVNVQGSVLHVIMIVNSAMAVAAVCIQVMGIWKTHVLVK